MENNNIQAVEWTEKCPCCKKEVKFRLTKDDNRNYRSYVIKGCSHFHEEFIDQSKYRMICNMYKQLYEDTDLLYARIKKKQDIEKLKMLGIDVSRL